MNYKLTYMDTNTYNQRCKITHHYKADSLEDLAKMIVEIENSGDVTEYEKDGRYVHGDPEGPENFFDAGGFYGQHTEFICTDTGEDMAEWFNKIGVGTINKYF